MTIKKVLSQLFSIALLSLLFIYSNTVNGQNSTNKFASEKHVSLDLFPLDLCLNFCFRINNKYSIGFSGEFGINFSEYIVMAGERFAKPKTLIKYEELDEYENGRYQSIYGASIFTRLFFDKKIPIDLGLKSDFFFHSIGSPNGNDSDQTGLFSGVFIKAFIPTKFKYKNDKKKRMPTIGVQVMAGQFREQRGVNRKKEFGVISSVWIRFDLQYKS